MSASFPILLSVLDFRRRMAMRPHLRCVRRMVLHPRHTEIAKLIVDEFRDQNILRLDIAVNDVPCLTEYQCLADILPSRMTSDSLSVSASSASSPSSAA